MILDFWKEKEVFMMSQLKRSPVATASQRFSVIWSQMFVFRANKPNFFAENTAKAVFFFSLVVVVVRWCKKTCRRWSVRIEKLALSEVEASPCRFPEWNVRFQQKSFQNFARQRASNFLLRISGETATVWHLKVVIFTQEIRKNF